MRPVMLSIWLALGSTLPAAAQTGAPSAAPAATPAAIPAATLAPAALDDLARGRVDAILKSGQADPNWFSDSFLSRVRISQVDEIAGQLVAVLGKYESIDGSHGDYTAHFEKGSDEVLVQLDAANRINAILFRPVKF